LTTFVDKLREKTVSILQKIRISHM